MHELSICRAMLEQVLGVARAHGATVQTVVLRVGPLSGTEPALLVHAYPIAAAGTAAAGSDLVIEMADVRVRCRQCGAETAATVNHLVCGDCGDWHTDLAGGDELLLLRVDLGQPIRPIGQEAGAHV
jgi:hydrogenase nickel incorporation protein HypA/HybF